MRCYVAGPMSGLGDFNFPAFFEASEYLESWGFDVENPAENPEMPSWEAYMRQAIPQLISCDCIALLPGWEHSRGASLEAHIAEKLGMIMLYL